MFSYYGSKSKVVHKYPQPIYDKIFEPFAGSARYSLKYFQRDITICDIDPFLIMVWHWLQKCSPKDIIGLPNFKEGDSIDDYELSTEERIFCGFLVAKGVSRPQKMASKWTTTLQPTWIPYQKKKIASNLYKIKHWNILNAHYTICEDVEATWFIDPPYQFGGEHYRYSNSKINYEDLSEWSENRKGQVIVCENTKANWMPFEPLIKLQGVKYRTTEAMWTNIPNQQLKLIA
jgi:hypothetical protein